MALQSATNLLKALQAVKAIKKGGSKGKSRPNVYKWIGQNYPGTLLHFARKALARCISEELLEHGTTNQRFKLTEKGREMLKTALKKKIASTTPKKAVVKKSLRKKTVKKSRKASKKTLKKKSRKASCEKKVSKSVEKDFEEKSCEKKEVKNASKNEKNRCL